VSRETELRQHSILPQLRPARRGIAAQRLQSCKTGITAQKEPAGNKIGSEKRTFFSKCTPDQSLTTALRSSDQQNQQQPSPPQQQQLLGNNMHQDTNQTSGQSVQVKNVNSNAMDGDMFLAFTMVQQIMTELSGAGTEKQKVAVITKAVFRLLKNNANNSS
jgi:hypothetical protein